MNLLAPLRSERQRASHANGARRRSGARESVLGSPRGEAPRKRLDSQVAWPRGYHRARFPRFDRGLVSGLGFDVVFGFGLARFARGLGDGLAAAPSEYS